MSNFKVKNRKRGTLRGGKNNGRFSNQVTSEQMMTRIFRFLENNGADILEAANEFYKVDGRGCVNISLTNHPDNPFKTGQFYYVTEEDNKELLSRMLVKTDEDIRISELIATYEPTTQAVVYVWYGTMYYVTKLTGYTALNAAFKHNPFTVH